MICRELGSEVGDRLGFFNAEARRSRSERRVF